MRIKLTVSYDGTNYSGWQVQPNGVTIQEKLEEAVSLLDEYNKAMEALAAEVGAEVEY